MSNKTDYTIKRIEYFIKYNMCNVYIPTTFVYTYALR